MLEHEKLGTYIQQAGSLLLQGVRKLFGAQESFFDHELAELATVVGCCVHVSCIGLRRLVLKRSGALSCKSPSHEGKPVDADHVRLDGEQEHGCQ